MQITTYMPILHWIGKDKVINHHHDVPFKVLDHQYTFNGNSSPVTGTSANKIIHGDNLEALKALLPEYEGKIKCIYIDPPYNTGNENWIYNDNVNDPKIKKWLGQVVGTDNEDLTRHDKWLCMMYPRLILLHKLLSKDGAIFISIDDNELSHLKQIMDEIFGASNFIEYFSWIKTSTAPSLAKKSRKTSEYILCYEKEKNSLKYKAEIGDGGDAPLLNTGNAKIELTFPNDVVQLKLPDGKYVIGVYDKVTLNNDIEIIGGFSLVDIKLTGEFKWTQATLNNEIKNGTTFIIKSDKFSIRYLRENEVFKAPTNLLKEKYFTTLIDKVGSGIETNEGAKKELREIFNTHVFDYPKPTSLIKFFVNLISDKDSIILDSFAGSGTTAHAVLNLNKQDGGNRKFILIEMEEYAENITAERVKRVINGYGDNEGTSGSFEYYELGEPLFVGDNSEYLNETVDIQKIRSYIWYSETRNLLVLPAQHPTNETLLGTYHNTAYYFIYHPAHLTSLDFETLATINVKAGQYIIYADNCLLSKEFLFKNNIVFKKIPRDISRF
jgi:adenine-specific DNA-methyltransferase